MNVVSLPYNLRTPNNFDFEWHGKALEWAKKYCPSYITNDCTGKNDEYYINYYFGDECDILWFKLVWSS